MVLKNSFVCSIFIILNGVFPSMQTKMMFKGGRSGPNCPLSLLPCTPLDPHTFAARMAFFCQDFAPGVPCQDRNEERKYRVILCAMRQHPEEDMRLGR
jgi:hypothetical protein